MTHPDLAADVNEAVLAADSARYRAMIKLDIAALERIFADDLVYMHSTGTIDTKTSLINALRERKFAFKSAETTDTTVRSYGDTAILNGRVRLVVEVAGTDHHAFSGFTTIWVRQESGWTLVHWQSTPLAKH